MTIEQRLLYHHSNHSGFTSRAKDWEVVYVKMFSKKSEALNFEKKIKSWKSKKMIRALISDNSKIE